MSEYLDIWFNYISLLHRADKICSSTESYVQKVKCLRYIFRNNEYPDWYINNTLKKFEKRQNNFLDKYEPDFLFTIGIPFFGKESRVFAKKLTTTVKAKLSVDVKVIIHVLKLDRVFVSFICCLM